MNTMKTIITAALDWAALPAAPCGVCQDLLAPLAGHQVDLATDGREEFLLFTPRLTVAQLVGLRPHRDCLLRTVITLATPQFFLIERCRNDGTWYEWDLRLYSFLQASAAWDTLVSEIRTDRTVRATWLVAEVPQAFYPPRT